MARSFATNVFEPRAAEWDTNSLFPAEELRQAATLGFAGIYCDVKNGGSGLKREDATIIFEELAAGCTSTTAYISIHNMASWMIDRFGNDAQRAKFLPKLMTRIRLCLHGWFIHNRVLLCFEGNVAEGNENNEKVCRLIWRATASEASNLNLYVEKYVTAQNLINHK